MPKAQNRNLRVKPLFVKTRHIRCDYIGITFDKIKAKAEELVAIFMFRQIQ